MAGVAIVTGGNSGIGRAAAVALAEAGFDVGFTWHDKDARAEEAAGELRDKGVRVAFRQLDLERPTDGPIVVDALATELDGLDVFVNNAGMGISQSFLDLDLDSWRRVLDVNLTGAFLCAQAAARRMVGQGRGGRIVNVTSVHEHVPLPDSTAYCSSKGGLGMLTKCMALELAEHGITVNAVAPGEIATRMTGNEDVDPRTVERPDIPAGRPGDAREIGAAIAWLASPGAAYATGQSFVIDGGLLLMAAVRNA